MNWKRIVKKVLATTLSIGLISANAGAISVPATGAATVGNTAKLDTRRSIRATQETLLSIRPTIISILSTAEATGFSDGSSPLYEEFDISEGSVVGLDSNPSVNEDSGAITFTFSASALYPNTAFANGVAITFTPVVDQSNYEIIGWDCSSAAASQNYGPSWDAPTPGTEDRVAKPLGYPYYGCTVTGDDPEEPETE